MKEIVSEYEIEFQYDRDNNDPSHIFHSLGEIVSSIKQIDETIINTLTDNPTYNQKLLKVEDGSIKSKILKYILIEDDDNLPTPQKPETESVQTYVKESKVRILKGIENLSDNSPQDINDMKEDIHELAKKYKINEQFFSYKPIEIIELANGIEKLTSTINDLKEDEEVIYHGEDIKQNIPKGKVVSLQSVKESLVDQVHSHNEIKILKIKKPDYFGTSKWSVKVDGKIHDVEIKDHQWLGDFQNKEFLLGPGDSIKAEIKIIETYN